MILRLFLYAILLLPAPAIAATIYVATKDYQFEHGEPPAGLEEGTYVIRAWLEGQPVPKLRDITPTLRRAVIRHLKIDDQPLFKMVVLGPPRVTNGKIPYFYAWVEWVHESELPFDLDYRRHVRKAGIAKVAIEGSGEKNLEVREWHWAERLEEVELHELIPWDAAVLAKKMTDFHKNRPRHKRWRENGPGKNAPY